MPPSALKIPHEIIEQILDSDVFASAPLSTDHPGKFPWFLGHICSTWRSVFLSMNTFWHEISIYNWTEDYERTIDIFRFFLERDPAAPFSFGMGAWCYASSLERLDCHMYQMMEMLADQSMRWKNAKIRFDSHARWHLPLVRIKDRLPLLQKLDFYDLSHPAGDRFEEPFYNIFQNAPALATVRIDDFRWKLDPSSLKDIQVDSMGPAASAALPQMTKLERLEIGQLAECPQYPDYNTLPDSNIVLPKLTKLICAEFGWLHCLEAPSLEELSVNWYKSEAVLSFLSRSSCGLNISFFHISYPSDAATVINIVRATPRIAILELEAVTNIVEMNSILQQLTIPTNSGQELLAPHLKSLLICYDSPDHINLYDMIFSRTGTGTTGHCRYHERLQELILYYSRESIPENLTLLCSERGVKLEHVKH